MNRWTISGFVILAIVLAGGAWWFWSSPAEPLQVKEGVPVTQNQEVKESAPNVAEEEVPTTAEVPPTVVITENGAEIAFSAKLNQGRSLAVSIATEDTEECVEVGEETAKAEVKTIRPKVVKATSVIQEAVEPPVAVKKPKPAVVAPSKPVAVVSAPLKPAPVVSVAPVTPMVVKTECDEVSFPVGGFWIGLPDGDYVEFKFRPDKTDRYKAVRVLKSGGMVTPTCRRAWGNEQWTTAPLGLLDPGEKTEIARQWSLPAGDGGGHKTYLVLKISPTATEK